MQGNLVGRLLVDALNYIDLAVVGPVGAKHPAARAISVVQVFPALLMKALTMQARFRRCCLACVLDPE